MIFTTAALLYASILFRFSTAMPGAMPWVGPMPTPLGLMATAGMSPRPTEAPGLNGIPQELRRRQNVQYPPPANWCGFVDGHYDNPVTCGVDLTCVNSGAALGCCTATTGICTALYTTCANYLDICGATCQANPAILKCDAIEPYCGTYIFPGATYLYGCGSISPFAETVEFLNDYYITEIGSTLASESTTDPFDFTASATLPSFTDAATSTTPLPFSTSSSSSSFTSSSSSSGLSRLAIDGIIIGASLLGTIVFAVIIFICIIRRRRRNKKAATRPSTYIPPPIQQAMQQPPPKAFGDYQSVPQQEQPPQVTELPIKPQQTASTYAPSSISALSPQSGSPDPRFSSANTTILTPPPSVSDPRQSYYKPPASPTVMEVDATMGNPGVPSNAPHGVPAEVDATLGNPGAPVDGHGVVNQMMPGGIPSATAAQGTITWAGGGAHVPSGAQHGTVGGGSWQQGPIEMDNHSRE